MNVTGDKGLFMTIRIFCRAALVCVAALWAAACGGGDSGQDVEIEYDLYELDPPAGYARMTPNNAFEGSTWFVADMEAIEPGDDLTGAVVLPPDDRDSIHVLAYHCNNRRCGVVIGIDEYLPSTTQPIPVPIDADSVQLRIERGTDRWESTLTVFPLEISRSSSPSYPLMLSETYMVSSLTISSGASLTVNFSNVPELEMSVLRWNVFPPSSDT